MNQAVRPSATRAERAALDWWTTSKAGFDHPCVTQCMAGEDRRHDLRRVDLRLKTNTTYVVMRLLVDVTGQVTILSDRRQTILDIIEKKPELSVSFAVAAMQDTARQTVSMALDSLKTSALPWAIDVVVPDQPSGQADLVVTLTDKERRSIRVKVKVFLSNAAKQSFNRQLTDVQRLRLITLVIRRETTMMSLVADLYTRLLSIGQQARLK